MGSGSSNVVEHSPHHPSSYGWRLKARHHNWHLEIEYEYARSWQINASGSSKVVEHLPRHPKFKGLNSATTADIVSESMNS